MAKTYHLNCPTCGGLLSARGERVIKCKFCGERSLLIVPEWMPSYYLKPKLDKAGARHAMVNLFKTPDVESGMLQTARFEGAELFFIPIYHLRARRVGTILINPQPVSLTALEHQDAIRSGSMPYRQRSMREIRQIERAMAAKPDTKVILSDVLRAMPAVRLHEWGAEYLDPAKALLDCGAESHSYNREVMDKLGTVLEPTVSAKERIDQIYRTELMSNDNTEIVDQRLELAYYPVWRARWKYQNRTYQTSLDAITGQVLFARAPAKQKERVLWLLIVSAAVGLSVGKLLTVLKYFLITGVFGMWFMLIFATAMLFFVAFGWNMFRYSTELVIFPDGVEIEWIGRPPETVFDKMANKMGQFMADSLRARGRGYGR